MSTAGGRERYTNLLPFLRYSETRKFPRHELRPMLSPLLSRHTHAGVTRLSARAHHATLFLRGSPKRAYTVSAAGSEDPTTYCRELVRKQDYEGFLLHPFFPRETQADYLALRAFYASCVYA
jgi:hypothetical protein